MPDFNEVLLRIILPIAAVPLLGAASTGVLWLLAQGWGWFRIRIKNAKVRQAAELVYVFATKVVANIEATVRPTLQAAAKDGKLTPAEIAELRAQALSGLKVMAPAAVAQARGVVQLSGAALDEWLLGLLEQAHRDEKVRGAIISAMKAPLKNGDHHAS